MTAERVGDRADAGRDVATSEQQFRMLVQGVTDYAIYMLDPEGRVASWNSGAQRIKGYVADEILGEHFSTFYTPEDRAAGLPAKGLAVALQEGLIVPVVRNAEALSVAELAAQLRTLREGAEASRLRPEQVSGGTFTLTNLGAYGIDSFDPILNPPQVAILGVGGISLKAVEVNGSVEHIPHLNLSLTINHQVVDGAPAARFLQTLVQAISQVDLWLAG